MKIRVLQTPGFEFWFQTSTTWFVLAWCLNCGLSNLIRISITRGVTISSTTDLEFLIIDKTIIVCFESHLMAGLGLPPSKFLFSILNYLRCELAHLNPNAIAALSCFSMVCKCWLRFLLIPVCSGTSTTPPTMMDKSSLGSELTLHHHHLKEYLNAKLRRRWKGASWKWFHVDIHNEPQWKNKHCLPP
jgi:hypothetical protein